MKSFLMFTSFMFLCGSLNAQEIKPYEQVSYGSCLAFAQYLNKEDRPTIRNKEFVAKYQPRMNSLMSSLQGCMKGKVDTPEQMGICARSLFNTADYDFVKGYNQGWYGIKVSEPNMKEIQSKYRTTCGSIIN